MTPWRCNIKRYTIEELRPSEFISKDTKLWLFENAEKVAAIFDNKFDFMNFDIGEYIRRYHVWVCRRDGKPVGVMMARLYESVFDPETLVLMQDLLYVSEPNTRAARLLLNAFVDFGRTHANLIFTMTTCNTNIKARSLERLGFAKSEQLFEMKGL